MWLPALGEALEWAGWAGRGRCVEAVCVEARGCVEVRGCAQPRGCVEACRCVSEPHTPEWQRACVCAVGLCPLHATRT